MTKRVVFLLMVTVLFALAFTAGLYILITSNSSAIVDMRGVSAYVLTFGTRTMHTGGEHIFFALLTMFGMMFYIGILLGIELARQRH